MPIHLFVRRSVSSAIMKRFGTRESRFKVATMTGFVIAMLGFLALGPDNRSLFASEDIWGSMSNLFGQGVQPEPPRIARVIPPRRPIHHAFHRRISKFIASAAKPTQVTASSTTSGQSVCVRLCDGYVFPVGTYHGESDTTAHEAICQSTCPGAATALYVMPSGAQTIQEATAVESGAVYSRLPAAFHYTTLIDESCTCQKAGMNGRRMSLLKDFTLRRGDAVMTAKGVKVFHGRGHFPYRRSDFVALAQSHDIRNTDRAAFGAIERASLKSIDLDPSKREPLLSKSLPSSRLEHQASRD